MPFTGLARRAVRIDSQGFRARAALVAGAVLLGLVAMAFARAGELVQQWFQVGFTWNRWLAALSPVVFTGVVWATRRWCPAARGSGIPQVMAAGHNPAQAATGPLVSLRTAAVKFAGTLA
ncbi:MAG TPA: chloride channel protein, partial [Novosphingobium sp.]